MSRRRDADEPRIVFSTDRGRVCPDCARPADACRCASAGKIPEGDGIVRVRREVKGRKGKGVTTLTGILLPADELKKLAKELKQACGTGGSVKDGVVEIQGDHRDRLVTELEGRGYTVKRAGG